RARPVVVVTGHQRDKVEAALAGLDIKLVHNPDFVEGLSTSVKAGLAALPVVPVIDGQRGNPVVWARRFFPELMAIDGDIGARQVISRYPEAVTEVALTDTAALVDVDTPDALDRVKAEFERA